MTQDLIAQPGQTWELKVYSRNDTNINNGLDGIGESESVHHED
ncbi:MAG: hypothetical protein R3E58_19260 [Phycisphaerae bacterium]